MVKRFDLHTQPQEAFWVIANDANGNVRTIVEVAHGGHDKVDVDIPAAMRAVLMTGASAFSAAHNHPTLSVLPSIADQHLTHAIMNAANTLGLVARAVRRAACRSQLVDGVQPTSPAA